MLAASWPAIVFVFAGLFSPGPNVVLLTASGARFGFRRTVPHLLGVPLGTAMIAALAALGVGSIVLAEPALALAFKLASAAWILWLAWRTAQAGRVGRSADRGRPLTFLEAVSFQAINPKVWAVAFAASAGFGIGLSPWAEAARLAAIFGLLNIGVCLFWSYAGHLLSGLLSDERIWRRFMRLMAGIMAATAVLIFL